MTSDLSRTFAVWACCCRLRNCSFWLIFFFLPVMHIFFLYVNILEELIILAGQYLSMKTRSSKIAPSTTFRALLSGNDDLPAVSIVWVANSQKPRKHWWGFGSARVSEDKKHKDNCASQWLIFNTCILGMELRSSHLPGRHFATRTSSLALDWHLWWNRTSPHNCGD